MAGSEVQSTLIRGLTYVVVYVGLDFASFLEPYRGLAITPWNPASGLALAVVLLGGPRYAPFVLLAPAVAGALIRSGAVPISVHLFEGALIGGSYIAVGLFAREHKLFDPRMQSVADALMLLSTAAAGAAMASLAYVGALSLTGYLESRDVIEGFVRFLIGDLIGILIVTPLVLLVATHGPRPKVTWEVLFQAMAIALALCVIFGLPHAREYQLFYLLFLPLLWCALRWGAIGAAVALAAIQVGLVIALLLRHGDVMGLTSFQMLMVSLSITGLVLGALVSQQQAASVRLRQQQLALNRAFRLRSMGEIASAIAHEVNQPVTSIRAFGGVAGEAISGGNYARAVDAITRLRSECDRVSSIIRTTRELLSQNVFRPELVEVDEILDEVRDLLVDRLAPNNIALVVDRAADAHALWADAVQLKQALYNIVDNSADAITGMGTGGVITVRVRGADPDFIEFEIRDTGPGFSPNSARLGMSPFLTTKADGTGIGLSIARSVAEAHGGGLTIEEAWPGAVVKLRIPAGKLT